MKTKTVNSWLGILVFTALYVVIISNMSWWEDILHYFFPSLSQVIYPRSSLLVMTAEHIMLVAVSSIFTIFIGIPLGIFVTRRIGKSFLPLANNLVSIGQTFPPVAVLALAVPVFGFGAIPTVIALFLYGLLPVVRNTIAGLNSVSADITDAARGLGMGRTRILFNIEIPLSFRVIMAGIRISVIINIGTAMIGAVIGSGGLGSPIIAGLVQDNIAFIIEGVVPAALLAILIDQILGTVEKSFIASP